MTPGPAFTAWNTTTGAGRPGSLGSRMALTTNRPYQVSRTHYEALDFSRHKLNGHVGEIHAIDDLKEGPAEGAAAFNHPVANLFIAT